MRCVPRTLALVALALGLSSSSLQAQAPASQLSSALFAGMKPRLIGPAGMSGRTTRIAVDHTNHDRIFGGAASGGVWLSEDGGVVWKPVFDDQPVQAIGHISVPEANPAPLWGGTGGE